MPELITWCREEITMMRQQVELMENGTVKSLRANIDVTRDAITEHLRRIAELDAIIQRYNTGAL